MIGRTVGEILKLPRASECSVTHMWDDERKVQYIQLCYWHNANLVKIFEDLPSTYHTAGDYGKKSIMKSLVRKMQIQLSRKIKELSAS